VLHDGHLYLLQFHAGNLEPAVGAKWHDLMCYSKAFHGLEVEDVSGFDLGLMLCLLLIGRKMKRKKKEYLKGAFIPGPELAVLRGIFTAFRCN
jgi:hypothetical protein